MRLTEPQKALLRYRAKERAAVNRSRRLAMPDRLELIELAANGDEAARAEMRARLAELRARKSGRS